MIKKILSILICSIVEREESLNRLMNNLNKQNIYEDVQILIYTDSKQNSIGTKRNCLINDAKSKYVCFIDDDDAISHNYIKIIREGCLSDADCISLNGIITFDGQMPKKFVHSIKYKTVLPILNEDGFFTRPPNHLNPIKKTLIENFKFQDINRGEDKDWALRVSESGVLKNEYLTKDILYYYLYKDKK